MLDEKRRRAKEMHAQSSAVGDQTKLVAMVTGSPQLDDVMGEMVKDKKKEGRASV